MLSLLLAAALAVPSGRSAFPAFSLQLPEGFAPDPAVGATPTAALVPIYGDGEPDRRLVAYFDEGTGAEAASLALSTVDAPLQLDPALRQLFASAVAGHFRRQLDLPFELERSALVGVGPARRAEVWGAVKVEGQGRTVAVAFFPGQRVHTVAVASFPSARAAALTPLLEAAFDSFVPQEPPPPWARSRTAISLAVWGLAGLVFAGVRLRRRRLRPADQEGSQIPRESPPGAGA